MEADDLRRILKRAMGKMATWQEIDQVKDHIDAMAERMRRMGRALCTCGRAEPGTHNEFCPVTLATLPKETPE